MGQGSQGSHESQEPGKSASPTSLLLARSGAHKHVHMAAYQNSWAQGWTARGSKKLIEGLIRV